MTYTVRKKDYKAPHVDIVAFLVEGGFAGSDQQPTGVFQTNDNDESHPIEIYQENDASGLFG